MKKQFEHPTIEACKFNVAVRLAGSSEFDTDFPTTGGAHDAGHGGAACAKTASNGAKACSFSSNKNSGQGKPCFYQMY